MICVVIRNKATISARKNGTLLIWRFCVSRVLLFRVFYFQPRMTFPLPGPRIHVPTSVPKFKSGHRWPDRPYPGGEENFVGDREKITIL